MVPNLERESFRSATKVNDALGKFLEALGAPRIELERVDSENALGRVLGKDVVANMHIRSTNYSVVDGYALRAHDVQSASENNPVVLEVIGESRIGKVCRACVTSGEAIAVATGSVIPAGADAVVMVEHTKLLLGRRIEVRLPVNSEQGIAKRGEDVSPGNLVLKRGHRLRPQDIGILKAMGVVTVHVVRRPRIAIMSTGNELANSFTKRIGKVVDTNRSILSGMVRELGAEPVDLGIARDEEDSILRKMRNGLRACDALLVTAGSSVGKRDLVPRCINSLGRPGILVHGVAMRPALPTSLAVAKGKAVLSLPGFPVSAMFAFRVFGRPLIAWMMGAEIESERVVRALLKERIDGSLGYRTFVRVTVRRTKQGLVAEPLKLQRSSVLMSMVAANGIVTIPEEVGGFEAGEMVDVSMMAEILL